MAERLEKQISVIGQLIEDKRALGDRLQETMEKLKNKDQEQEKYKKDLISKH